MTQQWKAGTGENEETLSVVIPEFKFNFLEITLPVVPGYSDESE